MEAIYQLLSGHMHATIVTGDVITIIEGPLNREPMTALSCVAEQFSIAYELKYVVEPATTYL
jgi:hypothetical protein